MPRDPGTGIYTLPLPPTEPRRIPVTGWANVTVEDLAASMNNIPGGALAPGSVGTTQLADNSVTNAKMADGSVSTAELVDSSVTNAKMADNSVSTAELVDSSVTNAKMADNTITNAKIADNTITPTKLAGMGLNGLVTRVGASTFAESVLAGTPNQIAVADGDGVAANPTVSIASNPRFPGGAPRIVGTGVGAANSSTIGFYESDGITRGGYAGAAASDIYLATDGTGTSVRLLNVVDGELLRANLTSVLLPKGRLEFPAIQNPSSNANTLDDYEEGTFTPALTFTTPGNLAVTYTDRRGVYTKIGDVVYFTIRVQTSVFTYTTSSGSLLVTGLPFASISPDLYAVSVGLVTGQTAMTAGQMMVGVIDPGSTSVRFYRTNANSANFVITTQVPTGAIGDLIISGVYKA